MDRDRIERCFEPLQEQALDDLARLVDTNSYTGHGEGLKAAGEVIVDIARQNGLGLERVEAGGAVEGAFHLVLDRSEKGPFWGVVGHFDTVHEPGSSFDRFLDQGEELVGPGVQDMKSGIVSAVYGLRTAREALGLEGLPVKIVFNCDEEIGSPDSRPLIEDTMAGAEAVLVFEGRRASDNALVTSRKGIMMGQMRVKGKTAHAGEAPQDGANAIVEAAWKITALDALTDVERGLVVTTGTISGGQVANQIPDTCTSSIDVRFRTASDARGVHSAIRTIMEDNRVPGCSTEYTLHTVRPPFEKSRATESLWEQYSGAAAEFGVTVSQKGAGGGSDGNLTAALGVPTLDGVGPAGDHAHTHQEYIRKASFFEDIKVFALFLANQVET